MLSSLWKVIETVVSVSPAPADKEPRETWLTRNRSYHL